jgi:hypothetical protein
MITSAPCFVSKPTLHNYLKIPFVHEEITLHANKYELSTTDHSNQLINEIFYQSKDVRSLQKNMAGSPKLGSSREQSVVGT